jgi:hypothetical protein
MQARVDDLSYHPRRRQLVAWFAMCVPTQDRITRLVLIGNSGLSRTKLSTEAGCPAPSCVTFRKPALIFRAIGINLQSDGVTDQM